VKLGEWSLHFYRLPYVRDIQWVYAAENSGDYVLLKLVADGNACRCASGMVRYCTACAAEPTERTTAAGAVHSIHRVTAYLSGNRPCSSMRCGATCCASKEESYTAKD